MRFLITGGLGFIGRHLARRLSEKGHSITVFDRVPFVPHGYQAELPSSIQIEQGDTSDAELLLQVIQKHAIDRIIHAASIAGVIASIDDHFTTVRTNILGGLHVLEAAERAQVQRVIDLSSEDIYGPILYEPVDEEHPLAPENPYAITKLSLEQFGKYLMAHKRLQYVAVRLCWVYGPEYPRARLPHLFLEDALQKRRTSLAQGGDHHLDLTYVDDAVEGICLVAEAAQLAFSAYNIASGTAHSVYQIAATVQQLVPSWSYEIGPGPLQLEGRYTLPPKGAIDITRASTKLGYHPRWKLLDGLASELASLSTKPRISEL